MIYLQLMWSFFQIGLFSIGGGYAAMPLVQQQTVEIHSWLTMSQFADVVTIAEMTPGPIASTAAAFVGMQVAGPLGAISASVGCVLPACFIVTALAWVYYRFRGMTMVQGVLASLRPAVVAMIASAGISLMIMAFYGNEGFTGNFADIDLIAVGIFVASLIILRLVKCNPIWIMAGAGAVGIVLYSVL